MNISLVTVLTSAKAMTMISVLSEGCDTPLNNLSVLKVGGSAGIIDEYLSRYFGQVTGIDIDDKAIAYANVAAKHHRLAGVAFWISQTHHHSQGVKHTEAG